MIDLIPRLRTELESTTANMQALEADVAAAQERLRFAADKAERIRALLAVYEAEAEAAKPRMGPPVLPPVPPPPLQKPLPKNAQMAQEITNLLAARGSTHRAQILEHLTTRGIMGREKNPMAHLAAFMSDHRSKFASDGRGNFTLQRGDQTEPVRSGGETVAQVAPQLPSGTPTEAVHDLRDSRQHGAPERAAGGVSLLDDAE
jgi:hypothetical protein